MSDLTPEQKERFLRARSLSRPESVRQTLADLEAAASGQSDVDLARLCADAATTIRSLHDQLGTERALDALEGRNDAQARERVLLLIAEAKSLRSIVRGLAAISPLAALEGGVLLCWACGVNTPVSGPPYRDGAELSRDRGEVVRFTHRDGRDAADVEHLPTCVWLLAATYKPDTEHDMDGEVAARAWDLLGDLVRIVAAEDDAQAEYDESPELQELLAEAAASRTAKKIDIEARRRARAERQVQDRDEDDPPSGEHTYPEPSPEPPGEM